VRSGLSELKRPTADTTCLSQGLVLTFRDQSRSILRAGRRGGRARRGRQCGSSEFRGPGRRALLYLPSRVVAELRAEPSADRERKVQAVDLTTKQFWQYQTSLRSNKFRVIAGTFNGLDSSVQAIDLQPESRPLSGQRYCNRGRWPQTEISAEARTSAAGRGPGGLVVSTRSTTAHRNAFTREALVTS
jgi:hypothetical protein